MDATKTAAARPGGDDGEAAKAGTPGRPGDEPARARAYLDLWERNVVQVALHGPAPRPGAGEGRGAARPPA